MNNFNQTNKLQKFPKVNYGFFQFHVDIDKQTYLSHYGTQRRRYS
jgi:uncharacterized protein YwqG